LHYEIYQKNTYRNNGPRHHHSSVDRLHQCQTRGGAYDYGDDDNHCPSLDGFAQHDNSGTHHDVLIAFRRFVSKRPVGLRLQVFFVK